MTDKITISFIAELRAAGVPDNFCGWSSNGDVWFYNDLGQIIPQEDANAAMVKKVLAVLKAHDPTDDLFNEPILRQIDALEQSVTRRRTREAVLGTDGGWLENLDAQITALRATLRK